MSKELCRTVSFKKKELTVDWGVEEVVGDGVEEVLSGVLVVEGVDDVETEVGGVELEVVEVLTTVGEDVVDWTGGEEVLEVVIGSLECEEVDAADVDVGVEAVDESKQHQLLTIAKHQDIHTSGRRRSSW